MNESADGRDLDPLGPPPAPHRDLESRAKTRGTDLAISTDRDVRDLSVAETEAQLRALGYVGTSRPR